MTETIGAAELFAGSEAGRAWGETAPRAALDRLYREGMTARAEPWTLDQVLQWALGSAPTSPLARARAIRRLLGIEEHQATAWHARGFLIGAVDEHAKVLEAGRREDLAEAV